VTEIQTRNESDNIGRSLIIPQSAGIYSRQASMVAPLSRTGKASVPEQAPDTSRLRDDKLRGSHLCDAGIRCAI
jgi:hypothetical protein